MFSITKKYNNTLLCDNYDIDGFFGKTDKKPCDAESVMKNGSSVCAGYGDVMQLLCRQVVKILTYYYIGYRILKINIILFNNLINVYI